MKGINTAVRLLLFFDGLFEVTGEYVLVPLERKSGFFLLLGICLEREQ